MSKYTEEYVNTLSPNSNAATNAKKIVSSGKLKNFSKSQDESIIFCKCKGSSGEYDCSVDFIDEAKPVLRCSCPSRQFPCKHALALFYAYVNGQSFTVAEIPEDLLKKREKQKKRSVKKVSKETPKETEQKKENRLRTQKKKIDIQLEGLDILEKFLDNIISKGVISLTIEECQQHQREAKRYYDYYLPVVYDEVKSLFNSAIAAMNRGGDSDYQMATSKLCSIYAIMQNGREYLKKRLENLEAPPDMNSKIEEVLGRVWKAEELKDLGSTIESTEFIQIAFVTGEDYIRDEFVDSGYWIDLKSGAPYITRKHRPFYGGGRVKEDDSISEVVCAKDIVVYPGLFSKRVRFDDAYLTRPVTQNDLKKVIDSAFQTHKEALKTIRSIVKIPDPLGEANVFVLIKCEKITKGKDCYVVYDKEGDYLVVNDKGQKWESLDSDTSIIQLASKEEIEGSAMLCRFGAADGDEYDDQWEFDITPYSIITTQRVIPFVFKCKYNIL